MKKLFLFLAFFGVLALADVNAQSCTKSSASCAAACAQKAAVKEASTDESIETRVSSITGETTYVRKNVCAQSGNVNYTPVEFCTKAGKFVNVSPSAAALPSGACSKSATTTTATAKGVSTSPSCTAAQKAACPKTCTDGQKASTNNTSTQGAAKMVKMENNK